MRTYALCALPVPPAVNCLAFWQCNATAFGIFLNDFLKKVEQHIFKNDCVA